MLPPYLQPEHAVSMQTLDGGSNRPILAAPCFIAAVSDAPDKLPYHSLPQMSIFLPIISVKVPCQMLGMELLQNAVRLCLKTERAKQIHETLSGDSRFLYITCAEKGGHPVCCNRIERIKPGQRSESFSELLATRRLLALLACIPRILHNLTAMQPVTPAAEPANSGRVPTGVPLLGCRSAVVCATGGTASQAESSPHVAQTPWSAPMKLCIQFLFRGCCCSSSIERFGAQGVGILSAVNWKAHISQQTLHEPS